MQRSGSNRIWFTLGTAAFLATAANVPFWSRLVYAAPIDSVSSALFLASVLFALVALFHAGLTLVSFRGLLKPVAIAALLIAALCGYFMNAYGVVIDRELIQSALETDAAEVGELVTGHFLAYVLLLGVLPSLLIARTPLRLAPPLREAAGRAVAVLGSLALCGGLVAAQFKHFALVGREHGDLRRVLNPVGPVQAALRYYASSRHGGPSRLVRVGMDARRAVPVGRGRRSLTVLVVGETARAANFSLNGYSRPTNPLLSALPIVNFSRMRSCGTATATSLPCMFSPDGSDAPSRDAEHREGLLDVLQRAGISVLWRDNNSGCKHTCDRVPSELRAELARSAGCTGGECYDAVLLSGLQDRIDSLNGDGLIVLHQQGSHGPAYFKRSPASHKRFLPECSGANLQRCSREAIANAYDNSILYTDWFLARLIGILQANAAQLDTALWYVSDHGESLGERGIYLHGLPLRIAPDEQTHVPMILWFSEPSRRRLGLDTACLERSSAVPHSHDELFHSMLGLFGVSTSVYRAERDLLAPCRSRAIAAARTTAVASHASGSSSSKRAPPGDEAVRSPPWARAIARAIGNPSPVPLPAPGSE
jgi:lipid A ethanolaminephosphotransferase